MSFFLYALLLHIHMCYGIPMSVCLSVRRQRLGQRFTYLYETLVQ